MTFTVRLADLPEVQDTVRSMVRHLTARKRALKEARDLLHRLQLRVCPSCGGHDGRHDPGCALADVVARSDRVLAGDL